MQLQKPLNRAAFTISKEKDKKKTLPKREGKRLSLVQRAGHAGLLTVGGVLGDDALRSGLVNSSRSGNQSLGGHVGVKLLQRGLDGGLDHLVAQGLALGNAHTLDSGLNVRHCNFPPNNLKNRQQELVYQGYMKNASCTQKMKKIHFLSSIPLTPLEEGAAMTYRTSVMRDPARCHGQWKIVSRPDYYKQRIQKSQALQSIFHRKVFCFIL